MNTIALKHGLIATTILVVGTMMPLLLFGTDFDYGWGEVVGYTTILIAMGTIFFALKSYRVKQKDSLTFKEGMLFGTYMNFIASLLFGIFSFVLYQWVFPEFLQSYLDRHIAGVQDSGESSEWIQTQMADVEENKSFYLSPVVGGFLMFFTVFPIGLVITTISSVLLKDKK